MRVGSADADADADRWDRGGGELLGGCYSCKVSNCLAVEWWLWWWFIPRVVANQTATMQSKISVIGWVQI